MAIKQENHIIKGIQRDLSRSKFSPEFAFDAQNIRLTAREGNTLLSVTNEKGTKECILKNSNNEEVTIVGSYIGHCVLNNYLVLFTTGDNDIIYRLEDKQNYFEVVTLYIGNLNLSADYPIETLGLYENIEVQKVYWTDNKNPIRFINISKTYSNTISFDLVKPIDGVCNFYVLNKLYGSGEFSSGVIQYAITFFNLYDSETSIVRITDLQYCSFKNRGASPEEKVNCSFELALNISQDIINRFDYARIYSIHRSSINAIPTVKLVQDISIKNIKYDSLLKLYSTTFIDNGTIGEITDSSLLYYIGGEDLIAKTLTSKDQTLFAGNITLKTEEVSESLRKEIKNSTITFETVPSIIVDYTDLDSVYSYYNSLNLEEQLIKGFKSRETYRFGIQFQNKKGKWSEVVFIGDKECNVTPTVGTNYINIPKAKITLPDSIIDYLKSNQNNYIRMRAVCVYPDFNDRNIICQGVLCPTVFNPQDRYSNSPYAQSSWFTRPNPYDNSWITEYMSASSLEDTPEDPVHDVEDGEVLFFKHYEPIYGEKRESSITNYKIKNYNITRNEIQTGEYFSSVAGSDQQFLSQHIGSFGVDCGIVTMYSPDIEFDNSVGYMKNADYKFRIVGAVLMGNTLSDVSITTSTSGFSNSDFGLWRSTIKNRTIKQSIQLKKTGRALATAPLWAAVNNIKTGLIDGSGKDIINDRNQLWAVYPWHRSGSLIASGVPEEEEKRYWTLKRKIISNLWYGSQTVYLESPYTPSSGVSPINTWHSGDELIRIKATGNPNREYYSYYGDVDKVVTYDSASYKRTTIDSKEVYGYRIYGTNIDLKPTTSFPYYEEYAKYFNIHANAIDQTAFTVNSVASTPKIYQTAKDAIGVEPVSMKYKSGPHAVFAFNYVNTAISDSITIPMQTILPNNGYNINDSSSYSQQCIWDTYNTTWKQETVEFNNPSQQAYLWLGELYRETINNRFGGDTPEAILNNTWEISSTEYKADGSQKSLQCWGDTYTQRYDALRTYEYTSEDTNSIVDILSFICETRVNIDGRYDRNRGNISNLTTTPLNFNLLNPVYNQRNNYFTYHTLDYSRFSNDYFPNTIVWSKEKSNAEQIDTWTNLNMLSSLDLDGDKGEIESLNTFNNEIYCFQKKGLSNILFNSRVQVQASDGVPIELTNGLKVGGKRYVSNTIGCTNKWSIVETPAGLYFIDNETNSLYLFNGQVQSLSDKLGFRQWIGENNSHEQWNPTNYKNFRTYYDKNNDDLYFINDKSCLCYSELLNQFTSFMSYEKVPAMFNINSEFYSFNKGKLWHNFEGDYNMFYGEFKPYSITVVANSDEPYDKIFNTVEFRSDSWNNDELINNQTFDTLEVWNEYQHGSSKLEFNKFIPSVLKKKFRVWRANIPRDDSNHRDRIRNTWAYVKLSMNTPNTWRTEFHDMNIHYFI